MTKEHCNKPGTNIYPPFKTQMGRHGASPSVVLECLTSQPEDLTGDSLAALSRFIGLALDYRRVFLGAAHGGIGLLAVSR